MNPDTSRMPSPPAAAALVAGGALLALASFRILRLETRHFVAVVAGIGLVAVGLALFRWIRELLLWALVFNLPLAGFEKVLFLRDEAVIATPGIGIGLFDFLLIALYVHWFCRIAVFREEPFPRPCGTDLWVLGFLGAHLLSWPGSASREYTFFEILRVTKFALAYFYVSRHLERKRLKWVVGMLFLAAALQSGLGIFQSSTGRLQGLGSGKGSTDFEKMNMVNIVPGFEGSQAYGTVSTAHGFGVFLGMILPIALALALDPSVRRSVRRMSFALFGVGFPAVVMTYCRGVWAGFAAACLIVVIGSLRTRRDALVAVVVLAAVSVPTLAVFREPIRVRLLEAPPEIMEARRDYLEMALGMIRDHPLVGVGANAYTHAHEEYMTEDIVRLDKKPPVHNIALFVAAQTGLAGLLAYFGVVGSALVRCRRAMRRGDPVLRAVGLGVLAGLLMQQIEGLTNLVFYTNVPYLLFWVLAGLSVAISRMQPATNAKGGAQ